MLFLTYFTALSFGTIICWIAFLLVILNIDPTKMFGIGIAAFFSSLFLSLLGTFTMLGIYIRRGFGNAEVIFTSFRQGALLTILLVGLLILQLLRVLTWWDGILFVLSVILLEFTIRNRSISYE